MNKLGFSHGLSSRTYFGRKVRSRRVAKRRFSLPVGLFEFQPEYILGVRISRPFRKVARVAVGDLDTGVISQVPGRPNIVKPEQVSRMVTAMANVLGSSKGPFGLLMPDSAVRVGILGFESLPADRREQESLVRWRMKPLLPFPVEDARLSFEVSPNQPAGVEVVAMAVRKSVIAEYESMMESLNGDVRLILPASAALLPLMSKDRAGGELLLHVSPSMLTAIVVSGQRIRMWRNQSLNGKAPEERRVAVAEEAARTLAASHDHLGLEISDVCLCARPSEPEDWVKELGRTLVQPVSNLAPNPVEVGIRLSAEERQLLRDFGATASGIVANAA